MKLPKPYDALMETTIPEMFNSSNTEYGYKQMYRIEYNAKIKLTIM